MALDIPIPGWEQPLRLTPRWTGDDALGLAALILSPLVLAGLLAWLFRWEARLVPRRAALGLLALRFLSLGVLWFVACFEPRLPDPGNRRGRVIIALDVSGSMAVADPRSPQEQLRMALVLRMKEGNAFPPSLVALWIDRLERGTPVKELPLLTEEESSLDRTEIETLANTRQKDLALLWRSMEVLTRGDIARRLLDPGGGDLPGKLRLDHDDVVLLSFADELGHGESPGRAGSEKGTNLNLPLQEGLKYLSKDDLPLQGLILLTDGRSNLGPQPTAPRKRGDDPPLPIFPVALGSATPEPDLALAAPTAIQGPRGTKLKLEVRVRAARLPAQEIVVEVFKKGERKYLVEPRRIKHPGNESAADIVHAVSFDLKFEERGNHPIEVKARLARDDVRELTTQNNRREVFARVTRDRPRVLLVDGEARWEYHYLSTFLGRLEEPMEVERVLFHQPRLGLVPEDRLEKLRYARTNLPAAPEGKSDDPLFTFDCIVLGDVAPEDLPTPDRERLRRFVSERGGTLVLVSGKRHLPLAYGKDAADPLVQLLPVTDPRPELGKEKGFTIELTPMGQATRWLALEDDAAKSVRAWNGPRHFWALAGKPKPGATVLAVARDEKGKLKEEGLIVEQHVGQGRVLWLGLESTWRFRPGKGYLQHERLWDQVLRWAATKDMLPAGNTHVRYGSREPVYEPGKEVDLAVRLGPDIPLPDDKVSMRLVRLLPESEEDAGEVGLQANLGQPRLFEARPRGLSPGRYRVEPVCPSLKKKIQEALAEKGGDPTFLVLSDPGKEMDDPASDRALLEDLAQRSGGAVHTPASLEELVRSLKGQGAAAEKRVWRDAPFVWWLFGLVLGFLTLEWLGRKWVGLP